VRRGVQGPLRGSCVILAAGNLFPVYPNEQTFPMSDGMSRTG
jgi:hypothetical protein